MARRGRELGAQRPPAGEPESEPNSPPGVKTTGPVLDTGVKLKCRPPAWRVEGRLGGGQSGREEWGRGQAVTRVAEWT